MNVKDVSLSKVNMLSSGSLPLEACDGSTAKCELDEHVVADQDPMSGIAGCCSLYRRQSEMSYIGHSPE